MGRGSRSLLCIFYGVDSLGESVAHSDGCKLAVTEGPSIVIGVVPHGGAGTVTRDSDDCFEYEGGGGDWEDRELEED